MLLVWQISQNLSEPEIRALTPICESQGTLEEHVQPQGAENKLHGGCCNVKLGYKSSVLGKMQCFIQISRKPWN